MERFARDHCWLGRREDGCEALRAVDHYIGSPNLELSVPSVRCGMYNLRRIHVMKCMSPVRN